MGFLDKAAAKVGEATKAAQESVAEEQARRKADGLLRELGAWTYAKHKGGFPDAPERLTKADFLARVDETTAGFAKHLAVADLPRGETPVGLFLRPCRRILGVQTIRSISGCRPADPRRSHAGLFDRRSYPAGVVLR